MTGNNKNKITLNRSSIIGKFITEKYAKSHPKTTQTEHCSKKK